MADCEAPSFSLGLDSPPHSPITHHDDFVAHVSDSDPDSGPDPLPRTLKRLRRGPSKQVKPPPCFDADDDIEEFSSQEDPFQVNGHPSAWNHSVSSSSKVSLNGSGVLTPHSSSNCRERKRKQASDIPASAKLETGPNGLVFPKLTASPLRRFQLIDSDSDDPVDEYVNIGGTSKIDSGSKEAACNQSNPATYLDKNRKTSFSTCTTSPLRRFQLLDSDSDDPLEEDVIVGGASKVDSGKKEATCNQNNPVTSLDQNRKTSFSMNQDQDLWKEFSPVKNYSIPTPAFNEVCEEYFRSANYKEMEKSGIDISGSRNEGNLGANSSCQRDQQLWESADPLPPAHQYFFHEDPRIQQLVRSRLCNFSPLGVNRANQPSNVSHIDYMGQFSNGGASKTQGAFNASGGWVDPKAPFSNEEPCRKKATKRNGTKNSMSKSKSKTNESDSLNVPCTSANWVEPKSSASMPKDAGKRRVQASGQSAGHWYTGSDGKKVYVNKSGQELTGRTAYRQYRKESGAGFKKSKKKASTKKNARKKN